MKIKEVENSNYCGIVTKITTVVDLPNCDNLQHAIIFGNKVIVTKDVTVGMKGIFFPVGTQMSKEFLKMNNMFSKQELNQDTNVKGYFGKNGLVRCVKLRGNDSEGIFVGMETIKWFLKPTDEELDEGVMFDELNGHSICCKYIPKPVNNGAKGMKSRYDKRIKLVSRIADNQFHFHIDTQMLYRNLDKFKRNDLISITYKIHGTSGITSKILCNRKLNFIEKLLIKLGVDINTKEYDVIYSSRKVIKNEFCKQSEGFYGEDIWAVASEELKPFLKNGLTFYYEIAGYLQSGASIQKDYHYGCKQGEHKIYIYRITYTSVDGDVYEFSMKQVQDFCKAYGLNAVPLLYYGTVHDYINSHYKEFNQDVCSDLTELEFENKFLEFLKSDFNEKDCYICNTGVPEEGCVVRKEINGIESYKVKSTRFLEKETIELESGEGNIEDEN